jgi:CRISPR type IV-associated protein Csf3
VSQSLHIVAHLQGALADRSKALMLDALLMAAVAMRDGLDPLPPGHRGPAALNIPLERDAVTGVWMATQGLTRDEQHESRWKNKRFPIADAQVYASDKLKRINLSGGPCRSHRIPLDTVHLADGEVHWWALGDAGAVEALLVDWVGYLGHRRAVGLGKVAHWHVEVCTSWGDGFPVVRNGEPMRPLPDGWPGVLETAERAMRCVAPPYWRRSEEELCAVPAWT